MSNNGFSTEINSNGRLTRERFENAGIVVGGTPSVVTSAAPFGQNVRSKSFFEAAIAAERRKQVLGIVQTGAWLCDAQEELDRDVFAALKLPFSKRTAQALRRLAKHPVISNPAHHGALPACWRTLDELAATVNGKLMLAALADGRIHPGLQRKDIRSKILGLPPKEKKKEKKSEPAQPELLVVLDRTSAADTAAAFATKGLHWFLERMPADWLPQMQARLRGQILRLERTRHPNTRLKNLKLTHSAESPIPR